jgi:hypothetical protein
VPFAMLKRSFHFSLSLIHLIAPKRASKICCAPAPGASQRVISFKVLYLQSFTERLSVTQLLGITVNALYPPPKTAASMQIKLRLNSDVQTNSLVAHGSRQCHPVIFALFGADENDPSMCPV